MLQQVAEDSNAMRQQTQVPLLSTLFQNQIICFLARLSLYAWKH
jgi:hypothetical protein